MTSTAKRNVALDFITYEGTASVLRKKNVREGVHVKFTCKNVGLYCFSGRVLYNAIVYGSGNSRDSYACNKGH